MSVNQARYFFYQRSIVIYSILSLLIVLLTNWFLYHRVIFDRSVVLTIQTDVFKAKQIYIKKEDWRYLYNN